MGFILNIIMKRILFIFLIVFSNILSLKSFASHLVVKSGIDFRNNKIFLENYKYGFKISYGSSIIDPSEDEYIPFGQGLIIEFRAKPSFKFGAFILKDIFGNDFKLRADLNLSIHQSYWVYPDKDLWIDWPHSPDDIPTSFNEYSININSPIILMLEVVKGFYVEGGLSLDFPIYGNYSSAPTVLYNPKYSIVNPYLSVGISYYFLKRFHIGMQYSKDIGYYRNGESSPGVIRYYKMELPWQISFGYLIN